MAELPEHLKKLCEYCGWEYSHIKIVDGVPRCCDTCKHSRDDGFTQRVRCTLDDIYFHRISICSYYERKEESHD